MLELTPSGYSGHEDIGTTVFGSKKLNVLSGPPGTIVNAGGVYGTGAGGRNGKTSTGVLRRMDTLAGSDLSSADLTGRGRGAIFPTYAH